MEHFGVIAAESALQFSGNLALCDRGFIHNAANILQNRGVRVTVASHDGGWTGFENMGMIYGADVDQEYIDECSNERFKNSGAYGAAMNNDDRKNYDAIAAIMALAGPEFITQHGGAVAPVVVAAPARPARRRPPRAAVAPITMTEMLNAFPEDATAEVVAPPPAEGMIPFGNYQLNPAHGVTIEQLRANVTGTVNTTMPQFAANDELGVVPQDAPANDGDWVDDDEPDEIRLYDEDDDEDDEVNDDEHAEPVVEEAPVVLDPAFVQNALIARLIGETVSCDGNYELVAENKIIIGRTANKFQQALLHEICKAYDGNIVVSFGGSSWARSCLERESVVELVKNHGFKRIGIYNYDRLSNAISTNSVFMGAPAKSVRAGDFVTSKLVADPVTGCVLGLSLSGNTSAHPYNLYMDYSSTEALPASCVDLVAQMILEDSTDFTEEVDRRYYSKTEDGDKALIRTYNKFVGNNLVKQVERKVAEARDTYNEMSRRLHDAKTDLDAACVELAVVSVNSVITTDVIRSEFSKLEGCGITKIVFGDSHIAAYTDTIFVLDDAKNVWHRLGRCCIIVPLDINDMQQIKVYNLENVVKGFNGEWQDCGHVYNRNQYICFGGARTDIMNAIHRHDLVDIIFIMRQFIANANVNDSAGAYIRRFPIVSKDVVDGKPEVVDNTTYRSRKMNELIFLPGKMPGNR